MTKETTVVDLKKIWNKYNDYSRLDDLLNNLRENDGKKIDDWLYVPVHLPFIKKELKNQNKDKTNILEAGCGIGHWVFWMAERGFDATGVDLSPKAITLAKKYAKKNKINNCKFIEGDVRKLPIKDNYFDIIFSFGLIEHFHKPEVIIKEFLRVLKPGGRIFLSVPNMYSSHTISRFILKILGKWDLGYEFSYNKKSLRKLFKNQNMEVLSCSVMPGKELFGRGVEAIPFVGNFMFKILSKLSLFIEKKQNVFSFWLYGVAKKSM